MGKGPSGGFGRRTFRVAAFGVLGLVAAQTIMDLLVTVAAGRHRGAFDLERSNSVPDLVSNLALAVAAAGALAVALRAERGAQRTLMGAVSVLLVLLTIADFAHDGAHATSPGGLLVVGLAAATVLLVAVCSGSFAARPRTTFFVAACVLGASLLRSGLRTMPAFDGRRSNPLKELRIVTKEGLELAGWSLIALALWDEALARRRAAAATARASGAPAPSRQRAA